VNGTIEPGYPGATGPTGPVATYGYVGNAYLGATDASGATSAMRATGPMGVSGATGATGAIGPTGPTGLTGSTVGHYGYTGPGHVGPLANPYVYGITGATGAGTATIGSAHQYSPTVRLNDGLHEHHKVTHLGAPPGHTAAHPVHQPTIGTVAEGAVAFAAVAGGVATVSATTWPSVPRRLRSIRATVCRLVGRLSAVVCREG
jgi:collagen type VII alpha